MPMFALAVRYTEDDADAPGAEFYYTAASPAEAVREFLLLEEQLPDDLASWQRLVAERTKMLLVSVTQL